MAQSSMTPKEVVDAAVAGRLDIPEFQRGFVWQPEKVKNLLDSLCRDYPIGSILCWRSSDYRSARAGASEESDRLWIVDGQQRTTALCLLVGKKPYWFPHPDPWNAVYDKCAVQVDLLSSPEELQLSLPNPVIAKKPNWHPVREILSIPEKEVPVRAIQLLGRIGKQASDTEELGRLMGIINVLHAAVKRPVVVVQIDHEPVDVAEIFNRLNSAGTRVNEGDVALALIAVRQEGWVREELLPFLDDLKERGFGFEPSFVIRSLAAIGRGSARLGDVPRQFWEASDQFQAAWTRTKGAFTNVLRVLREIGVLDVNILPSRNVLIPLFVLDDLHAHGDALALRKAFLWLLHATRAQRYGGSAITVMEQDVAAIRAAADAANALDALHKRLDTPLEFTAEDFLRRYDEDDFLKLMLYLVAFNNGAEDWKTGQRLGYDRADNALNEGFRPEWHHFVPRGRLRRRQPAPPPEDLVNALANIVVLGEGDNRRFSYNEPLDYLRKYGIPDERVRQQFFPDRGLWNSTDFERFVAERSLLLAAAVSQYINDLRGSAAWPEAMGNREQKVVDSGTPDLLITANGGQTLIGASAASRQWMTRIRSLLQDLDYEEKKYWATFRNPPTQRIIAQLNPTAGQVRVFTRLPPDSDPHLSPGPATAEWGERFPSVVFVRSDEDADIAARLVGQSFSYDLTHGSGVAESVANVLLYIKEDQVDWVFENEDIGSGSPAFKGMAKEGNRVFVASKSGGELAVVGEIPVSKVYEEAKHPKGWKFRVTADAGASVRYAEPVNFARVRDELSILRGAVDIWPQIQYPRWLSPEDAALLSRLGHGPR